MSCTRQTVVFGPSLTGFGKRPALTPAHHVDLPTGMGPRREDRGEPHKPCLRKFKVVGHLIAFVRERRGINQRSIRTFGRFGYAQEPETEIGLACLFPLSPRQQFRGLF